MKSPASASQEPTTSEADGLSPEARQQATDALSSNYPPKRKPGRPRKGDYVPPKRAIKPRKVKMVERPQPIIVEKPPDGRRLSPVQAIDSRAHKGEIVAVNHHGDVVAALSVPLLAQALLRKFGDYDGLATSIRMTYDNAKSERTKVSLMSLVYQTIKVAQGQEPPKKLNEKTKEELEDMFVEKLSRLAEEGPEAVKEALHMLRPDLVERVQQELLTASNQPPNPQGRPPVHAEAREQVG